MDKNLFDQYVQIAKVNIKEGNAPLLGLPLPQRRETHIGAAIWICADSDVVSDVVADMKANVSNY